MVQPKRSSIVVVAEWKYAALRLKQRDGGRKYLPRRCQNCVEGGAQHLKIWNSARAQTLNQLSLRVLSRGSGWLKEFRVLHKRHEPGLALPQTFIRQKK